MWTRISPSLGRSLVASIAALGISALLVAPAFSDRATVTQASVNVAVVPGFTPPAYPGYFGVPALAVAAPELSAYHFTALAPGNVTAAALQSHDTVLLRLRRRAPGKLASSDRRSGGRGGFSPK